MTSSNRLLISCFPHVVNLAVKAVLTGLTDMKLAASNAPEYNPTVKRDPIASVRDLVRVVSS